MSNFRTYVAKLTAGIRWARAYYGERLTEGFIGLFSDLIAEGANEAVKARFDRIAPPDALPYIGQNKDLERYFADTDDTYRARLLKAFSIWQQAGTRHAVLAALQAYGFATAELYEDKDWTRPPKPWWSQFWILFRDGTHTVTATAQTYGDGSSWGDPDPVTGNRQLYGVTGITAEEVDGLRRLVKKWKPSRSICRELIFEDGGITFGSSITFGGGYAFGGGYSYGYSYGGGQVYGGTQSIIGAT